MNNSRNANIDVGKLHVAFVSSLLSIPAHAHTMIFRSDFLKNGTDMRLKIGATKIHTFLCRFSHREIKDHAFSGVGYEWDKLLRMMSTKTDVIESEIIKLVVTSTVYTYASACL